MITARGTGKPGVGGMKRIPILWRNLVRSNSTTKLIYKRLERVWRKTVPQKLLPGCVILLSYPRSGSHWTRYVIESITGYRTLGARDGVGPGDTSLWIDTPISSKVHIPKIRSGVIAIKRHKLRKFEPVGAPIILVVRDPSKAIISHCLDWATNPEAINQATLEFIDMVRSAESRTKDIRIVYFEDLVSGDRTIVQAAIQDLMRKLGVVSFEKALNCFTSELDTHAKRSLLTLERPTSTSTLAPSHKDLIVTQSLINTRLCSASNEIPTLRVLVDRYDLNHDIS
jgi:hypothetical protein